MKDLPEKYLQTESRKEMWREVKPLMEKIVSVAQPKQIHAIGSMLSNKENPDDIDFAMIVQVSKKSKCSYPIDIILVPEDEDLDVYLKFFEKHMADKYGKESKPVRLL